MGMATEVMILSSLGIFFSCLLHKYLAGKIALVSHWVFWVASFFFLLSIHIMEWSRDRRIDLIY